MNTTGTTQHDNRKAETERRWIAPSMCARPISSYAHQCPHLRPGAIGWHRCPPRMGQQPPSPRTPLQIGRRYPRNEVRVVRRRHMSTGERTRPQLHYRSDSLGSRLRALTSRCFSIRRARASGTCGWLHTTHARRNSLSALSAMVLIWFLMAANELAARARAGTGLAGLPPSLTKTGALAAQYPFAPSDRDRRWAPSLQAPRHRVRLEQTLPR
ncbi:hypothetical protein C8Q73DRAFT_130953 [Cubamyces lactineus]|nr:hypothetical protein C8Q73DRAFT_130953 [Cubamyces lactineus]